MFTDVRHVCILLLILSLPGNAQDNPSRPSTADAATSTGTHDQHTSQSTEKKSQSEYVEKNFPHLDKSSTAISFQDDQISSTSEDFIEEIISHLAEYINDQVNNDLSAVSPSSPDIIVNELKNKLQGSNLHVDIHVPNELRATIKLLLRHLRLIIDSVISNLDNTEEKDCSVKFTFLNRVFCMKFEVNLTAVPRQVKAIGSNLANISVESFQISQLASVDTPPSSWQQWYNPSLAQDQRALNTNEAVVVCYYTNWAQYRNGPGRFYPENLDVNLCTHIVYAFAQLTDGVLTAYEWNDESTQWSTGMYARMMKLRKASKPKILLAVGGWNHGSGKFSDMVRNQTKRATFVTTTIIFLQKHKFDGLDLDWEYPGSREGSRPTDKDDFTKLVVELRKAFNPYGLLLTAAVGAGKPTIDAGYDIPKVCENLDLINLMSYDLHGSWETETGIHVPLYSRSTDTELNKQLTQDWAVRYWLDKGCSKSKLVMGLALYGRTFRLASSSKTQLGAAAVGPGAAGLYTGEAGFLGYYEICTRVQQQGWTKVFDEEQKSNYAYKGQEWVGYDDVYSIALKAKYARDMGLAGIMFWAPDLDDFTGNLCQEGKYPLMNAAVNVLRNNAQPITSTTSTTAPTRTSTSTTNASPPRKRVVCYYTNWAQYRPDGGKFLPENLDASLCTHIIYAFAVLKDFKLASFEWNDEDTEWSKGMYSRMMELKKNNDVKILLAVGGWNFGSGGFSDMVADEKLRKEFVRHGTQFVRDNKFDGLDLDWEYPGSREGSRPEDKQRFTSLVKELDAAFEPYGLLLTAAVGAGASTIEVGYEIDQLAPHLDFINLMTYDLHGGAWENQTGLHTALYARPEENAKDVTFNQNWAVNQWIEQGMPKEKISMGLAAYGRSFKLVDNSSTAVGAVSFGAGEPGKYTREPGFLAYYEICEKLSSGQWISKYDDVQKSMYAYGEGTWVGYDNIDTMIIRANYINGKDLGGVMFWAPDLDDYSGKFCNQGRYPLMNTVVNLIRSGTIVPIATSASSSTTTTRRTSTTTTTTTSPSTKESHPSVICMARSNALKLETINGNLCDQLIIVQSRATQPEADVFQSTLSSETLKQLKSLQSRSPQLKIVYSILGQWNSQHLNLIRSDSQRRKFNEQILAYLLTNQLDGLDIDWNVPSTQIFALTDKSFLSTWLSELQTLFAPRGLYLSIGISADKGVLDASYEWNKLSARLNLIRLMAFDWTSTGVTSLINPLYPVNNDKYKNINWAINYLLTLGIPPEQVSLGVPTYGRAFLLANANQHAVGSPTLASSAILSYSNICKLLKSNNFVKDYVQQARSSYVYNINQKQWISFNTKDDLRLKARFARLQGLAGVSLFSVELDDADGECGQNAFPLLNTVVDVLKGPSNGQPPPQPKINLPTKHIFCSISSKAETFYGSSPFSLEHLDAHLCTHLLIPQKSSFLSSTSLDRLKTSNTNLKILLTLNINDLAEPNQLKEVFAKNKVDGVNIIINTNHFSSNITEQVKLIRQSWPQEYLLTLSLQIPTDPAKQMEFFQMIELHRHFDLLVLLPFDGKSVENFHRIQSWNSLATFVQADPVRNIGDFSMVSILLFVLSMGVPREKLIFGIPTYGLSFLLDDEQKYRIGDSILAQGLPGRVTHTIGMLASYEICDAIRSKTYERTLSNDSIIVLGRGQSTLVLFDDTQALAVGNTSPVNGTVELKTNLLRDWQLAGVLVHSIDMDDYTGSSCRRGKFPITSIVSRIFAPPLPSLPPSVPSIQQGSPCLTVNKSDLVADDKDVRFYYVCSPDHPHAIAHLQCPQQMQFSSKAKACISTQNSTPSDTKSEPTNAVAPSEGKFVCPSDSGLFVDPRDCTRFYSCANQLPTSMKCPATTKFNSGLQRCDWTSDSCV